MEPTQQFQQLPLDPRYKPPTNDAFIMVRFIGNTAYIADIALVGVGVGHIDAAVAALGRAAQKMYERADAKAEAEAERNRIAVTGEMPPDGYVGTRGLRGT